MNYKHILLSPLGLVPVGMQPAAAADMPVKAPAAMSYTPDWTGWYAGINAGIVSDRSRQGANVPAASTFNYCWAADCAFSNSQTAVGFLGGVQAGYNFQSGKLVYGIEADIDLTSARKTTSGTDVGYAWSSKSGPEALGTVRLRLGYAFDQVLLYATGGLAYAKMSNSFNTGGPTYSWSDAGWHAGYAVGGGIEYMLNRKWSIKGEALYYDLGSKDHVSLSPVGPSAYGLNDRMSGVIARVGLNYLFH